jgi:hypothetical protein
LGQTDYMRECLKKCVAAICRTYYEYAMAAFLLKSESGMTDRGMLLQPSP